MPPGLALQAGGQHRDPASTGRFPLLVVLLGLLAFAIREHFVLATIVDAPIHGDIKDYVAYAWNLYHHGVYSLTAPQSVAPLPDAYRPPGFPWLLMACMHLRPQVGGWDWYDLALQVQVVLGTSTVVMATLLARQWLAHGWALLAGLLLAIWPHHVAATGSLLTEVLFGFLLVAGMLAYARGWRGNRTGWFILSALAFGYAYLVNPLVALFPLLLCACLVRANVRAAALLLGIFLVPVVALGLRNAQVPSEDARTSGRAVTNLVQGAWPEYHDAYRTYFTSPDPKARAAALATMEAIGRETDLVKRDARAGLSSVAGRIAQEPARYATWYLWRKPWLLWDWNIQLGEGGINFHAVRNSPFDTSAALGALATAMRMLNPLLTAMLFVTVLVLPAVGWRRKALVPAMLTAALAAYLTLVHVVLQGEPRYAIAYRGIEVVLVVSMLAIAVNAVRGVLGRVRAPAPAVSRDGRPAS